MQRPCPARPRALQPVASEEELRTTVRRLADEIAADHGRHQPLVVLGIMKGVVIFLADLVRHLPMPLQIEFVSARSYNGTRQETVEVLDDLGGLDLEGKAVLLVDCVLDTGRTLASIHREVVRRSPADLKTCVLLSKQRPRRALVRPDYVGLGVPDVFLVGYGLDHDNRWRHLPYVAELRMPEDAQEPE